MRPLDFSLSEADNHRPKTQTRNPFPIPSPHFLLLRPGAEKIKRIERQRLENDDE